MGMGFPYLSFGQLRLDSRPSLALSSITEQIHDNGALGNSLVHIEQVGAWNPTILYSFFPGCAIFAHTDYDIETIVTKVETLTVALGAITDECESVVFEVFLDKVRGRTTLDMSRHTKSFSRGQSSRSSPISIRWQNREIRDLTIDSLFVSGEINCLDTTSLLLNWTGQSNFDKRSWSWSCC